MLTRIALITAALIALHHESRAQQFMTGNDLYVGIQSDDIPMIQWRAIGFIQGVYDMSWGKSQCGPEHASTDQITSLIFQRLHRFPEFRHRPAAEFAEAVFIMTWPCAKKSKGNI